MYYQDTIITLIMIITFFLRLSFPPLFRSLLPKPFFLRSIVRESYLQKSVYEKKKFDKPNPYIAPKPFDVKFPMSIRDQIYF